MLRWMLVLAMIGGAHAGYSFEASPSHPDWEPGIEAIGRADWDAAVAHLGQVVRNEPENADAHNALGFAYLKARRREAALRHFRTALALDPRHRGAHENAGLALVALGNKAKAREHLAALKATCGDCDEYRGLARALAAAK